MAELSKRKMHVLPSGSRSVSLSTAAPSPLGLRKRETFTQDRPVRTHYALGTK